MYASQDYTNKEQGGLRFKSGDSVYVLLRNGGGWCTGKNNANKKTTNFQIVILVQLNLNSFILINTFIFTGMANGVYGTFRESAVSRTKISKTLNYSKFNLEKENVFSIYVMLNIILC